jgi:major type 1 subunit fimbrin (pilin)
MKHIKLASALVVAMGIVAAGSASAATSGGTITFTGTVTDTTCAVSGGSGTTGGKDNFTVPLDSIAETTLNAQGNGNPHPFNMQINEDGDSDCVAKTATFSFDVASQMIDPVTGALKNNVGNKYAQNTEIQLLNSDNQIINLADPASATLPTVTLTNNQGTISLIAQYLAPNKDATAGAVRTNVQYNVVYN